MSSEPGGEWVSLRSIVTSHTTIYGSAIHTHWRAAITVKENEKNIILGCKNDNCMNTDAERHLVGQVHHAQVRLYFEAEGWEAGHAVLWPGELMEDDGVFRIQLLLLPAQMETTTSSVTKQWSLDQSPQAYAYQLFAFPIVWEKPTNQTLSATLDKKKTKCDNNNICFCGIIWLK